MLATEMFLVILFLTASAYLPPAKKVHGATPESVLAADDACVFAGDDQDCALYALQSRRAIQSVDSKILQPSVSTLLAEDSTSGGVDAKVAISNADPSARNEAYHAEGSTSSHCLMLHVGPPKTGSTTIQHDTLALSEFLRDDGVKVLHSSEEHVTHCFWSCNTLPFPNNSWLSQHNHALCENDHRTLCTNLSGTWKSVTKEHRITFLSSEAFAAIDNVPLLASTLQDINTTIILVYRPYYELFASSYRQKSRLGGLPDFNVWATSSRIRKHFSGESDDHGLSGMSSLATFQKYRTYFRNIKVHTLNDDLVPNIVCNDFGAVQTCERVRGNASTESRYNVRREDDFTGICLDAERVNLLRQLSMRERYLLRNALEDDEMPEDWEQDFQHDFAQSFSSCFGMR